MRSLTAKLLLSFLAVLLLEGALGMLLVRRATHDEFERFIREEALTDFIERSVEHYDMTGSWDGVRRALRPDARGQPPPEQRRPRRPKGRRPGPPERRRQPPPPPFALADADAVIVIAAGRYRMRDVVDTADGTPIEWNGARIGTVLRTALSQRPGPSEERYMERADGALLGASLIAVAVAALFAFFAARIYTNPLRQLTEAAHAMKKGELHQEVPVTSDDELGELTSAFNQMSADLARSQAARRRMTADITHDLRTPLTVITGYLEAMCEGTLEPTTERLETLRREADQLHRLIADLRTLSLADAGELDLTREPIALRAFLDQATESFLQRAANEGINIEVQASEDLPTVELDPERMARVLKNLIANAFHHTSRADSIILSARRRATTVELTVKDSGAGIPAEALPHVFDRFYRADPSRARDDGSSGLGLAIAKSIVDAHGGTIAVESDLGRGTTFTLRFDLSSRA